MGGAGSGRGTPCRRSAVTRALEALTPGEVDVALGSLDEEDLAALLRVLDLPPGAARAGGAGRAAVVARLRSLDPARACDAALLVVAEVAADLLLLLPPYGPADVEGDVERALGTLTRLWPAGLVRLHLELLGSLGLLSPGATRRLVGQLAP